MNPKTLAGTGAAVATAAVLGSVASAGANSPWYLALDKPVIQPPKTVFPIVWTLLYADIAISSAVTIDRLQVIDPSETVAFKRALAVNLVLNTSWSWVFFKAERLVNMSKHDYRLEPNVTFSPDRKWIIFRSNMLGPTHVFAVEIAKAAR